MTILKWQLNHSTIQAKCQKNDYTPNMATEQFSFREEKNVNEKLQKVYVGQS